MTAPNERSRPAKAAPTDSTAIKSSANSTPVADDWQRAANAIGGAYAVAVITSTDRCRRRVFLTLASAEDHAMRAEAAGHIATVVLVRLEPIGASISAAPAPPNLGRIVDAATGQVAL